MCDRAGWNKQIPRSNLSYRAPMAGEEHKLSLLVARHPDGLELFGYLISRPASSTRYGSPRLEMRASLHGTCRQAESVPAENCSGFTASLHSPSDLSATVHGTPAPPSASFGKSHHATIGGLQNPRVPIRHHTLQYLQIPNQPVRGAAPT